MSDKSDYVLMDMDSDYAVYGPEPERSPEDEARIKAMHKELGIEDADTF